MTRYIPDWGTLMVNVGHKVDRDNEMISVTRETLRIAERSVRANLAVEYYHTSGAAQQEMASALENVTTKTDLNKAFSERVNAWIKRKFSGYGIAHRAKDAPKWEGEPFMSMQVAKDLTLEAVLKFRDTNT